MKSILITGASSGLGRACALEAANRGWQVTACGRNPERLSALASEHRNIDTLAFDLTDLHACRTRLAGKRFDVIVLNAGTCEYVDVEHWDTGLFKRVFDANFFGAINCLDALLPGLREGDQLVFVDSLARCLPFTRSQAYGASKAALHYLAKTMEVDLVDRKISVQTVSPGFVDTPLTAKNEFEMPMRMTADKAAVSMLNAIDRGARSHYFPRLFSSCIRLLSGLPVNLQVALCRRLRTGNYRKARSQS